MSEQVQEQPAAALTPAEITSVKDYQAWRSTGEPPAEPVEPAAEPAKPETKAEPAAEPDPASEAGKALAKKRNSLQERIDELTREKHDSRREADAAKAEAAALKARLAALEHGKTPAAEPAAGETAPKDWQKYKNLPGAPKEDDFESYGDFIYAAMDFITDQKLSARDEASKRDAAERAHRERFATHDQKIEAVRSKHADYDAVMDSAKDLMVPPHVVEYFLESEHGAELAYHLAKHHDEARSIAAMSPLKAIAALGRIEDRLTAAPTVPAAVAPVTNAPEPVKTVGARSSGASTADPKDINSVSDWRKRRAEFDRS